MNVFRLIAGLMCLGLGSLSMAVASVEERPVDLVYPMLDSANSRWFFFNSATRPFGMVNLSPDTEVDGAWGSGYRYNTTEIKGFSHVHAWQLSGLSIMPVSSDKPVQEHQSDYYSKFSHSTEVAKPGYHKVILDRYNTSAELTATMRVGLHRYQYGDSQKRQVMIPLSGKLGPVEIIDSEFTKLGPRKFGGFVMNGPTRRRPRPTPVFFYLELDTDVVAFESWHGKSDGVRLQLADGDSAVHVKVGISYTDVEGARKNLEAEAPHWDFDQFVSAAIDEWNEWLSIIAVDGGTKKQRQRFYTDLFHALQGRRTINDVDGRYSDQTSNTRTVKQLPLNEAGEPRFSHHNSDSFWGAQWTIQTLWPLAYPQVASNFSNSLLTYYRDGGLVPRGPSGGNYTYVMTGASSTPFLVSNWMKGIRDIDENQMYLALRKNHMPGGIMSKAGYDHTGEKSGGLMSYIEKGYAPYPPTGFSQAYHQDGAGQTLEYAYQDWALAQLAAALGHTSDALLFSKRGQNYKKLFDAETGFMRPRTKAGSWYKPFDPYKYQTGFVESNAAQMTWFVPQDYAGLAELMGGKEALVKKLNGAFEKARLRGFTAGTAHDQETNKENRRIPINYGNQPSIQTAFIFNEVGAPSLTQKWSRQVVEAVYSELSVNRGYNGDEDQGLMGSLAVLMKIGLFQLDGGVTKDPKYQIGSPLFDEVTIKLSEKYYSGRQFVIRTVDNGSDNVYIQSATLNGQSLDRLFLYHSEITSGGVLELVMGSKPALN